MSSKRLQRLIASHLVGINPWAQPAALPLGCNHIVQPTQQTLFHLRLYSAPGHTLINEEQLARIKQMAVDAAASPASSSLKKGLKDAQQQQHSSSSARRLRIRAAPPKNMDRFQAEFYKLTNIPDGPDADNSKAGAIRGVVEVIKRGLKGAEDTAASGSTTGGAAAPGNEAGSSADRDAPRTFSIRVANASSMEGPPLCEEYRPDPSLLLDALKILTQLHRMPVEPYGYVRDKAPHLEEDPQLAAEIASQIDVILLALERSPRFKPTNSRYHPLLCALSYSGDVAAAEAVFDLMSKGLKGPEARPNMNTADHLFKAFYRKKDVEGMWRLAQKVATGEGFDPAVTVGLRSYPASKFIAATMHEAALQQSWGAVRRIVTWLQAHAPTAAQNAQKNAAQETDIGGNPAAKQSSTIVFNRPDNLVHVMYSAAQAGQGDLALDLMKLIEVYSSGKPIFNVTDKTCNIMFKALTSHPEPQVAATHAKQLFTSLQHALKGTPSSHASSTAALRRQRVFGQRATQTPGAQTDTASASQQSSPSSSQTQQQQQGVLNYNVPGAGTYMAYINILSNNHEWEAAVNAVYDLEQVHSGSRPESVSAAHGLSPLVDKLATTPGAVAQAYQVLLRRQAEDKPVTTRLMNIILRALALSGQVEQASKLFEEYELAGLKHDQDSYNAVMESCVVTKQPIKAASIMQYMRTQNVQPNSDSYDLLVRSYLEAGDAEGARLALIESRKVAGVKARVGTLERALQVAKDCNDLTAEQEFQVELEFLMAQEKQQQAEEAFQRRVEWY